MPKHCYYIRRSVFIIKEYLHGINHEYKFKSLKICHHSVMSLCLFLFILHVLHIKLVLCFQKKRGWIFSSSVWLKNKVLKWDNGKSWETFFQFCEAGDLMFIAKFGPLLWLIFSSEDIAVHKKYTHNWKRCWNKLNKKGKKDVLGGYSFFRVIIRGSR